MYMVYFTYMNGWFVGFHVGKYQSHGFYGLRKKIPTDTSKWARISYEWNYTVCKWPYKRVAGGYTPISGFTILLISSCKQLLVGRHLVGTYPRYPKNTNINTREVCHNLLKQPSKIGETLHHQGTIPVNCNKVLMVDPEYPPYILEFQGLAYVPRGMLQFS